MVDIVWNIIEEEHVIKFMESADSFIADESGQGLIEYAGVVVIAVVLVLILSQSLIFIVTFWVKALFLFAIVSDLSILLGSNW